MSANFKKRFLYTVEFYVPTKPVTLTNVVRMKPTPPFSHISADVGASEAYASLDGLAARGLHH